MLRRLYEAQFCATKDENVCCVIIHVFESKKGFLMDSFSVVLLFILRSFSRKQKCG